MGAYETWRATREMVAEEKDPERKKYLTQVQEMLQPSALLDYLESASHRFYRDPDGWSAEAEPATSQDVRFFLDGLDELRAPSQAELQQIRRDLHKQVLDATSKLLRMPWTGETRYDEAIADVRAVLSAVIDGKPWPVLERLRCPSIKRKKNGEPLRCSLQLPHDGEHKAFTPTGGMGSVTWSDGQSVNPPKPYDDPTKPTEAQLDKLAAEVFGPVCEATYKALTCRLPSGHSGHHYDAKVGVWGIPDEQKEFCRERHPQTRQLCVRRPHPDSVSHITANGRAW